MSGIGVILNPHSRSNRHNPERIRRLAFIVGDKGSCHTTQDVLDVQLIAEEYATRGIEVLCISGGDGTIHHTISTVIRTYGARPLPKICLLRGGTVNNVASAVGMKGTPEDILSRLILQYHGNDELRTETLHCLDVNGDYGFLFGNGFVSNFIREYIRLGEGGGKNIFLLMTRLIVGSFLNSSFALRMIHRFDATVTLDGRPWPFKNYVLVSAGAVEPFGVGVAPFHRAREQLGNFHALAYAMTPRQICGEFFRVWRNQHRQSENRLETLAKELVIQLKEPMQYMIDGEIYPPTATITVKSGPALQMVIV